MLVYTVSYTVDKGCLNVKVRTVSSGTTASTPAEPGTIPPWAMWMPTLASKALASPKAWRAGVRENTPRLAGPAE